MSMTGIDAFDTTLQKTNVWIREYMEVLGWQDKEKAYHAMKATLHALRDRLTIDEAAQLGAQLPMLIRGFYYEGWDPTGKPVRERHKEQFLARIAREFMRHDPEQVARALFTVLAKHVSEGEIKGVKQVLPAELRELWGQDPGS